MEYINQFTGGISKDTSKIFQPKDTARSLKHWVQLSEYGDTYSISNENGVTDLLTGIPIGYSIIGHTVLDNDIIIILANNIGYSQVGIIGEDKKYVKIAPDASDSSILGFNKNYPVDCVAKKTYAGDRILYYTDNHQPFGAINLDNTPEDSELRANSNLIKELKEPTIIPYGFKDSSGTLYCGVYQFSVRYINEDLSASVILGTTNVIPVVDGSITDIENKDGNTTITATAKSILLKLVNIDTRYERFQLIVHRLNDAGTVVYSYSLPDTYITDSTMLYEFTGVPSEAVKIDLAEVRKTTISYDRAKCIEQIGNRLVLGNLRESTNDYNTELQNIANNITIRYKMEEEPLNSNIQSVNDFELFTAYDEVINSYDNTVTYVLTDIVDISASINSFTLYPHRYATASKGSLRVATDDITYFIGEELTIGSTTFNFVSTKVNGNDIVVSGTSQGEILLSIMQGLLEATDFPSLNLALNTDGNFIYLYYTIPGTYTVSIYSSVFSSAFPVISIGGGSSLEAIAITASNLSIEDNIVNVDYSGDMTSILSAYTGISVLKNFNGSKTLNTLTRLSSAADVYTPITSELSNLSTLDYKNELSTTFKKSFKRNETYSFALSVKFKDGSDSYAFHIPGGDLLTTTTTEALPDSPGTVVGNTEGVLGTYVSDLDYPSNVNLPGNREGDTNEIRGHTVVNSKIRHHKMPSLIQEPTFRLVEFVPYIRILGLNIKFNIPFSAELTSKIQNISILRETREKDGNKSIISQGFGLPMREIYSQYEKNGTPVTSSRSLMPDMYFGQTVFSSSIMTNYNKPLYLVPSTDFRWDEITYHSPDITLGNLESSALENVIIKPVLKAVNYGINHFDDPLKTKIKGEFELRSYADDFGDGDVLYVRQKRNGSYWQFCKYVDTLAGVNNFPGDAGYLYSTVVNNAIKVQSNEVISAEGFSYKLYNNNGTEFLALKLNDALKLGNVGVTHLDFKGPDTGGLIYGTSVSSQVRPANDVYTTDNDCSLNILELSKDLTSQYGELTNSEYIKCFSTPNIPTEINEFIGVYGGDTFITEFSTINKRVLPLHVGEFYKYEYSGNPQDDEGNIRDYMIRGSITDTPEDREDILGFNAKCLYSIILESNINCGFRHEFYEGGTIQTRYYPKSNSYETLKVAIEKGDCISYNAQYSMENAIKTYFNNTVSQSLEGDYSNRIIYSDNSGLDSIIDNYRQFPVNNYQDIPKHTGVIWDLFILNDTIYAHTPKSLWRLYNKNNTTIQSSNISEVLLGTGDAFTVDATEVNSFKGGYAGSISQFAGVHTPAGYIFPDALQGKIFLFSGNGLQELSRVGLLKEFNNNLAANLIISNGYIDNPYTKQGILSTFDFNLKRYLISKKGYTTYSYSFISNCWFSEHDYIPDCYIALNNKLYMVDNSNNKFYEANTGNKGDFKTLLPAKAESTISFIVNAQVDITKVFDNMIFNTNSYDSNNDLDVTNTFSTIKVMNDLHTSIQLPIVVNNEYVFPDYTTVIAKYKNNEFRISIPRVDEFTRLKSKYMVVQLTYDNILNNHFVVNFVKTLYRINKL